LKKSFALRLLLTWSTEFPQSEKKKCSQIVVGHPQAVMERLAVQHLLLGGNDQAGTMKIEERIQRHRFLSSRSGGRSWLGLCQSHAAGIQVAKIPEKTKRAWKMSELGVPERHVKGDLPGPLLVLEARRDCGEGPAEHGLELPPRVDEVLDLLERPLRELDLSVA
jgi:hypothetical protein